MTRLKSVGSCIDTNGGSEASLESCLNRALKAQKSIPLCQARTFTSRRSVSRQTHGLIDAANELGARAKLRKKHISTDMAGLFNLEGGSRSGMLEGWAGWSRPLLTHLGAYHHHKLWQSRFSVLGSCQAWRPLHTGLISGYGFLNGRLQFAIGEWRRRGD